MDVRHGMQRLQPKNRRRGLAGSTGFLPAVLALLPPVTAFALILAQAANAISPLNCFFIDVLLLSWSVFSLRRLLTYRQHRLALLSLLAISVLVECAPEFLHWSWRDFSSTSCVRLVWVISGWVCVLSGLNFGKWHAERDVLRRPRIPMGMVLVALSATILTLIHYIIRGKYGVVGDEVMYFFQSQQLSSAGYGLRLDPSIVRFFIVPQSFYAHGLLFGQYPPGWPLLLHIANRLGALWFTPPVFGAICVGLTYLLGKYSHSNHAGLLAGAFLATNQWFIVSASTYYSHIASTLFCLAAGVVLLYMEQRSDRSPVLWGGLCGLFLGIALATRPLTAFAAAISLAFWYTIRRKIPRRRLAVLGLAALAGAVLPVGVLLHYNSVVTGSPWRFGYQAANGTLHDLGFGTRGIIYYAGGVTHAATENFTVTGAVSHFLAAFRDASLELTPLFLIIPILFLTRLSGLKYRYTPWLAFAVLPAVHFFYFFSGARFYIELLPFLMAGSAVLIADLRLKNVRIGGYIAVLFISANLMISGLGLRRYIGEWWAQFRPYFAAVEKLHEDRGKVLIFVRDGVAATTDHGFVALWWFNARGIPGDIIIARDLGAANRTLMATYPQYCSFLMSVDGFWRGKDLPDATRLSPTCQ